MEDVCIKETKKTPEIIVKVKEGIIKITGRSLPENVRDFYFPFYENFLKIVDFWKNESKLEDFEFHVKLGYFNSTSAKYILDLLYVFISINENRYKSAKIYWYYEKDDFDMKEAGMQMEDLLKQEFEYVEYE